MGSGTSVLVHRNLAKRRPPQIDGHDLQTDGGEEAARPLRVALLAPPMLPIPPVTYAGTERVVAALGEALHQRGHSVTLFGPGDSQVPYELVSTVGRSLWPSGYRGPVARPLAHTAAIAWREHERFDLIHSHIEQYGFELARRSRTPVLSTLHGRLDGEGMPALLDDFTDIPLVAISASQRRWSPAARWEAVIHHGLPLDSMPWRPDPGDYLCFVGRATPEKGLPAAIELARRTGLRLRIAAKVMDPHEVQHFREVIQPAVDEGIAEYMGEVAPPERDQLMAGALATVMLGAWPEPFGLVAIESMATGTPVIARRAGALPEIIRHGLTGYLVDDVSEAALAVSRAASLDRRLIRRRTLERFSAERMADDYERVYRALLHAAGDTSEARSARATGIPLPLSA